MITWRARKDHEPFPGPGFPVRPRSRRHRPLRRRVEPPHRLDDVAVQKEPGRERMGRAVHVDDPPAHREIPRVGRRGKPGVAKGDKERRERVDVESVPGGHRGDRVDENLGGEGLLRRGGDRGDDHGGGPGKEAVERAHPVVNRGKVRGYRLVRHRLDGREREDRAGSEIGGQFPGRLLRLLLAGAQVKERAAKAFEETGREERPRPGREPHPLDAGGGTPLREGESDVFEGEPGKGKHPLELNPSIHKYGNVSGGVAAGGGAPHSRKKCAPWGTPAVGRTGGTAVQVHRTASHERSPALRGDAAEEGLDVRGGASPHAASRGTASIASRAAFARTRTPSGTVTTGERSASASRTSSSVVSFMFGHRRAREAMWNRFPGFSFRRR